MYVVITRVQLKPGRIKEVQNLFEETNPELVDGEESWIRAKFTANHEEDQVTVLAYWHNVESYREFSSSESFRNVMAEFAPHFAGQPDVSVNEILFEM
jgi:heme-degrading monooxygenase HmoA